MKHREHNIVVRVDDEEQAMARKLSEVDDEPVARMVRRFIRRTYAERFADAPALPAKGKNSKQGVGR